MNRLYILYDSQCDFCRRCRIWLGRQPSYVPLVFLPIQSSETECRFPGLKELHPEKEIVVISDAGDVWQGGAAWVICLWALHDYREWSQRLAHPTLLPLARRVCEVVSANRHALSKWLSSRDRDPAVLAAVLATLPEEKCGHKGYCKAR